MPQNPEGGGTLTWGIAFASGGYQWPIPAGVEPLEPSTLARALRLVLGYVHLVTAGVVALSSMSTSSCGLNDCHRPWPGTLGRIGIGLITISGIGLTVFRLEPALHGTFGVVFIAKLAQFVAMVAGIRRHPGAESPNVARRCARGASTPADQITAETLPQFNGRGRAAIGGRGKLCDVTGSRLWKGGWQHQAGRSD